MKIPILIGAEQGGANAGSGTTNEDTTMGSATDVSQGGGGGGGGSGGGGGDGSSTSLQSGGGSGVSSNSNSAGLMALSDEDSVEPNTSYGMVNSNSSQHSLSLSFKQEPLMDTDPRYAWEWKKPIKQPNQKKLKLD